MSLSWALVIATCNRQAMLLRCLRLALAQTRLPAEVVIVDASDDWQQTASQVHRLFEQSDVDIALQYVAAERKASASQRNQGIRLATSDVLFLIDDDSMMYPHCAAKVMAVYEADTDRQIAGVGATAVVRPPDADDEPARSPGGPTFTKYLAGKWKRLGRMLCARVLRVHNLFYPYDGSYPQRPIPQAVRPLIKARTSTIGGYRLTARREMIERTPFEELLERYTAGEDLDATYRLSRLGALVNAADAPVCHLQDTTNRLSLYTRTALHAMNIAVLNRLHSEQPDANYRGYRWYLCRRMVAALFSDLNGLHGSLPQVRGLAFALRHLRLAFQEDKAALCRWYGPFQEKILDGEL